MITEIDDALVLRKVLSLFSISRKAGKLAHGGVACENALRGGKARLVIVCGDASANTKKKFSQKAFYYKVDYVELLSKDVLNKAAGLENRSAFAVCDAGIADGIKRLIGFKEVNVCPK